MLALSTFLLGNPSKFYYNLKSTYLAVHAWSWKLNAAAKDYWASFYEEYVTEIGRIVGDRNWKVVYDRICPIAAETPFSHAGQFTISISQPVCVVH